MYCYSVLESTFFLMPFSDASPNSSPLWTLNLLTNASSAPFRQKCKGCVFLLFLTRQKVYCKACLLWHLFVWEYGFFMSVFVSFGFVSHFTFIPDDWEACKSVHYETFLSVIVCVYCKLHLFKMFLLLGIACLSTMWLLGEHITSLAEVIMIITQIVSPFKTFR